MKKILLLSLLVLLNLGFVLSQVSIGTDNPNQSAILDISGF